MARTRMAFVAACVVGTAWTCGAVDGTMWLGAPSSTAEMRYQDRQYWIDSQVAGEGGVASFSANSFSRVSLLRSNGISPYMRTTCLQERLR